MKKTNILIILSLLLMVIRFSNLREYLLIRKGNSFSLAKEFVQGDTIFKKAIDRYDSKVAKTNSVINLYEGDLYKELVETTNKLQFLRGNSNVYIGEKEEDPEIQIEGYKKALEEYKLAMKNSDDINIKKNYEIILQRIEDVENQQQQNQDQDNQNNQDNKDNKDNKDDSKKDNQNNQGQQDQQDQQNQDQQNNQQDQNSDDKNSDKQQDQNPNQDKDNTEKNNQDNQNNNQNDQENDSSGNKNSKGNPEEKSTEKLEALATLERLEGNEEQAFKNNEKLQYLGGDTDEGW